MEDFLTLAWFSGTRSGRDQMHARATEPEPDLEAVAVSHLESEFKGLMDQSADILNLTVPRTISMWNYLHAGLDGRQPHLRGRNDGACTWNARRTSARKR